MYASLHSKHPASHTDARTGNDAGAWVWPEVEVCVAIICASLPTLRALFYGVSIKAATLQAPKSSTRLACGLQRQKRAHEGLKRWTMKAITFQDYLIVMLRKSRSPR